jgi:hypothetical protein
MASSRRRGLSAKEKCLQYLTGNKETSRENDLEIRFINDYKGTLAQIKLIFCQHVVILGHGQM